MRTSGAAGCQEWLGRLLSPFAPPVEDLVAGIYLDQRACAVPHCDAHVGGGALVEEDTLAVRSCRFYRAFCAANPG